MTHVVYKVGPWSTEELRYSLRSLAANVDVASVTLVGTKPDWVRNVEHISVRNRGDKFERIWRDLRHATTNGLPEQFALFDDDMFALRSTGIPNWHGGELTPARHNRNWQRVKQGAGWADGLEATRQMLATLGVERPLNYELHTPMMMDRDLLAECFEALGDRQIKALQPRTLYGNLQKVGGRKHRDVKVGKRSTWRQNQTWVSTSDKSFKQGNVGHAIRDLFPDPSLYEEAL